MIKQKIMMDEARRMLLLNTDIPLNELVSNFQERDFYAEIYKQMAIKVADKIFDLVAPAIDKAMKEFLENPNDLHEKKQNN